MDQRNPYKWGAVAVVALFAVLAIFAPAPQVQAAADSAAALPISEQAARGMVFSTVGSCGCEVPPQASPAAGPGWKPMFVGN
jgi:hypothetical protein